MTNYQITFRDRNGTHLGVATIVNDYPKIGEVVMVNGYAKRVTDVTWTYIASGYITMDILVSDR